MPVSPVLTAVHVQHVAMLIPVVHFLVTQRSPMFSDLGESFCHMLVKVSRLLAANAQSTVTIIAPLFARLFASSAPQCLVYAEHLDGYSALGDTRSKGSLAACVLARRKHPSPLLLRRSQQRQSCPHDQYAQFCEYNLQKKKVKWHLRVHWHFLLGQS